MTRSDSALGYTGTAMTMQKPRTRPKRVKAAKPSTNLFRDLAKIAESIPANERAKWPTDISKNVDHYLYGSPKEE